MNLNKILLSQNTRIIIFFLPIVLIFYFLFLKILFNSIYTTIIQEDNLIESAEVVAYLISSFFAFTIAIDFLKTNHKLCGLSYLVLCIVFIFLCGEEISWGQRLFNINIPKFFKINNVQKELTLHNLDIFHYLFYGVYVLVGFTGAFAWFLLSKKIKDKYNALVNFFIPDWYLIGYFLPAFIIFSLYCLYGALTLCFNKCSFDIENGSFFVWRDQEPAELLLAFGFLFFMMISFCSKKQKSITI